MKCKEDLCVDAYVPPVVRSVALKPTNCILAAKYNDKDNRTRFTYSISWEEENDTVTQTRNALEKSFTVGEGREVDNGGATKAASSFFHEAVPLSEIERMCNRSMDTLVNGVRCDGPCEQGHSPEEMIVLGRCGHYLCNTCKDLSYNPDGSIGCSSFKCFQLLFHYMPEEESRKAYQTYLVTLEKEKEKKLGHCGHGSRMCKEARQQHKKTNGTAVEGETNVSMSPAPSTANHGLMLNMSVQSDRNASYPIMPTSQNEMICVRLMVVEPGPYHTIKRTHLETEVQASETVLDAIKGMIGDKVNVLLEKNCACKLYFIQKRTSGLSVLPTDQISSMRLCSFPARNSSLHFAIDYTGYYKSK